MLTVFADALNVMAFDGGEGKLLPLLENEAPQKGSNIFAHFRVISNGKDTTESQVSKIAFHMGLLDRLIQYALENPQRSVSRQTAAKPSPRKA